MKGNIRVVYDQLRDYVVQQTDYYPYGLPKATSTEPAANPYKYGSKELNTDTPLSFYDFEARMQLPALGLFQRPDPKAENFPHLNSYTYCGADPVNKIDPTGMLPFDKAVAHNGISSPYGDRPDPLNPGKTRFHSGIDLSTRGEGHDVHVIADGTIKSIKWNYKIENGRVKGYGKYVTV